MWYYCWKVFFSYKRTLVRNTAPNKLKKCKIQYGYAWWITTTSTALSTARIQVCGYSLLISIVLSEVNGSAVTLPMRSEQSRSFGG